MASTVRTASNHLVHAKPVKYSSTPLLNGKVKSQTLEVCCVGTVDDTRLHPTTHCKDIIKALQGVCDDEFMEVSNFNQHEFEMLCHMINEECPDIPWKLKLTFFVKQNFLMIQLASAIHEAPISEFNSILSCFQQVSYPRNIVHIQVSMNSDMEEEFISAIPDLALVISSVKGNKIQHFPLIVECTFSQPHQKVFEKVAMLIAAHPEVLMVVIVLINESPRYQSPSEKSLAWKTFASHQDSLGLTDFTSLCDVDSGDVDVDEDFMVPLVVAGHTWCHISSVDYYVWLKRTPNTSNKGSPPELPRNKNLDHFDRLLNKGLEMIQLDIMRFCQEIAIHHNLPADYSGLEKSICLPPSWDHFCSALVNAREITTHTHFMRWYKDSFRGKKRRTTEPNIKPGDSGDQEVEPICKRTVGGWEVGQRQLCFIMYSIPAKVEYKGTALPEGPDAVQCPEILGPCKHCPPCRFAPAEDDPDPPPAPTRNPAPVVSPTSTGVIPVQAAPFTPAANQELEFVDIDGALKGNADEGDDDDNKYNDTEHPDFAEEAPQRPIPRARRRCGATDNLLRTMDLSTTDPLDSKPSEERAPDVHYFFTKGTKQPSICNSCRRWLSESDVVP
ncbi:hypothetical protein BKA83DRAFT_4120084 [Pisolithus microcarpus]|nr:hypothetical protein BKA83DRAFT_4120084 [Pisolithus microcarpus]